MKIRKTVNHKRGFTLIELLITLTLLVIFSVFLILISRAISANFDLKGDYSKAVDLRDRVIHEIEVKLRGTTHIAFSKKANKVLTSDDFKNTNASGSESSELNQYNAIFSNYGMVFTIDKNRSSDLEEITNIESIRELDKYIGLNDVDWKDLSEYIEVKYDNATRKVKDMIYVKNKYLNGLFINQEFAYISEKYRNGENSTYNDFAVDVSFKPLVIYDYNKKKANRVGGVILEVSVRKPKSNSYITSISKDIRLLNLSRDDADSDYAKADDFSKSYSILYYNKDPYAES